MSTFTTCFYAYNNSYALKVATVKLVAAVRYLRDNGCTFSTFSDRSTGRTKIYLKHCPDAVVKALTKKFGFFNAEAIRSTKKPAPAPTTSRPSSGTTSTETRYWTSRAEYEAAMGISTTATPAPAVELKSSTQHIKEMFQHRERKADPVSPHPASYYNPLGYLLEEDDDALDVAGTVPYDINNNPVDKAAADQKLSSRPVASGVGDSPSFATSQQLYALTVERSKRNPMAPCLLDLAECYGIANRHSMNKAQLVKALSGKVPSSEL